MCVCFCAIWMKLYREIRGYDFKRKIKLYDFDEIENLRKYFDFENFTVRKDRILLF